MVLVDTSVLIGFLKGSSNPKVGLFKEVLLGNIPFGISALTFQEVLQGARSEADYLTLKDYLSTQNIYHLPQATRLYEQAARMYFDLRRRGVTLRSTIDLLIAQTAIEHNLYLLHDDRDFDAIAMNIHQLKVLEVL